MSISTASALLHQARVASGLSQRALAARAGQYQSNVAAIESGRRDANCETLADLVQASGGRLCVLPTADSTVADVADAIRRLLVDNRERAAYRSFVGLHDDLVSADPATRVALCVSPPAPVGDSRYDALLAALVEHDLSAHKLPIPTWATDPGRDAHGWWVEDLPAIRDRIRAATPPAFVRHGIWLDGSELASV
jgi:transcriptional regulator with XRE-family HTH domain